MALDSRAKLTTTEFGGTFESVALELNLKEVMIVRSGRVPDTEFSFDGTNISEYPVTCNWQRFEHGQRPRRNRKGGNGQLGKNSSVCKKS